MQNETITWIVDLWWSPFVCVIENIRQKTAVYFPAAIRRRLHTLEATKHWQEVVTTFFSLPDVVPTLSRLQALDEI